MQQRLADARRAAALRAVARASGRGRRFLGLLPRRIPRHVGPHEFRPEAEDVWRALRY